MRTKTLFLAAAALAAGLATSQAQSNVYSVNVVGYINVPVAGGSALQLLANPLDAGNNALTNIGVNWTNGTQVQTWNGTGFDGATKSITGWSGNPTINPGSGFFIKANKAQTLTFVGSAPTSNNYVLVSKVNVLVGAVIPIAGLNTDSGANTLNLPSLPNGTQIQVWNGTGFNGITKSITGWSGSASVPVAGGFFVKPGGSTSGTWKQWLQ
jgi:hypothetical protein